MIDLIEDVLKTLLQGGNSLLRPGLLCFDRSQSFSEGTDVCTPAAQSDERRTIEVKPFDVERPDLRQCRQEPIRTRPKVGRQVIVTRMQEPAGCGQLGPEVALVSVAGRAAVHEVVEVGAAARRPWLEVIDLQVAANLCFVNSAIAAATAVEVADNLTKLFLGHG
jgi:hypothetical protein